MGFSAEERDLLANKLGWGQAESAPTPMAPPPANVPDTGPGPLEDAIAASNARPGAPVPLPPGLPPFRSNDAKSHLWSPGEGNMKHALGADQTIGYTGPAPAAPGAPMPMPQMHAAPAGWHPSSRAVTEQRGVELSPETKGAAEAFDRSARAGAGLEVDALKAQNAQRAEGAGALSSAYDEAWGANASRAQRQEEALAAKRERLTSMIDDVSSQRVDPDHYFKEKSVGAKIGMVISMALGGFVAGRTGRPNDAMAMIQHAVDTDISAQKENITNKRAGVASAQGQYDTLRSTFHDENERAHAGEILRLEAVKAKIDQQAAQSSDPLVAARAEQLKAETEHRILEAHAKLDEASGVKRTTQTHDAYSMGGPAGGVPGVAQADQKRLVRAPDGSMVLARDEKVAERLAADSANTANIQANIQEAIGLRKQLSIAHPIDSGRILTRLRALQAETAQMVTVKRGQGSMSHGDQEVTDRAVGDMASINPFADADSVLQAANARFGQQLQRDFAAETAPVVQSGFARDARGNVVQTGQLTGGTFAPQQAPPRPSYLKPSGQ